MAPVLTAAAGRLMPVRTARALVNAAITGTAIRAGRRRRTVVPGPAAAAVRRGPASGRARMAPTASVSRAAATYGDITPPGPRPSGKVGANIRGTSATRAMIAAPARRGSATR